MILVPSGLSFPKCCILVKTIHTPGKFQVNWCGRSELKFNPNEQTNKLNSIKSFTNKKHIHLSLFLYIYIENSYNILNKIMKQLHCYKCFSSFPENVTHLVACTILNKKNKRLFIFLRIFCCLFQYTWNAKIDLLFLLSFYDLTFKIFNHFTQLI